MNRAACVGVAVLASATCLAGQKPVYRAGVDLVHFGVSVTDRQGQPVIGLTADDFELIENGHKQTLKYFAVGDPDAAPPLHLGLLFDTSSSMADDLQSARSAAVKFINSTDHAADVTFVDFDTEVRTARFTPTHYERLVERIRMRKADGMTALYDALGVYLAGAAQQEGQKVLVLYTDGGDTTSSMTFREAVDLLKTSDVTVYVIGYLQHQSSSGAMQQRSELDRFAAITGGHAYYPVGGNDLEGVFDKIQQEIAARYSLGYVSTDERTDGAWRPVEIKLLRRDLKGVKLRTRAGYYAPYMK